MVCSATPAEMKQKAKSLKGYTKQQINSGSVQNVISFIGLDRILETLEKY